MSNSFYVMTGLIFSVSLLLSGCSIWGGSEEPLVELNTEILPELKLPEGLALPERSEDATLPNISRATLATQSDSTEPPPLMSVSEMDLKEDTDLPTEMPHAYITEDQGGVVLLLEEKFEHVWRRLELSLERNLLHVEDRDRTAGIYYISQLKKVEEGTSWFNTVFRDFDEAEKFRFRIVVKQDKNAEKDVSRIMIRNEEGKAEKDKTARDVLSHILEGMR